MHLIVCLEENNGLSFCGRRLSSDREATSHILKMTAGSKLRMNPYSAALFPDREILVDEDFLEKAGEGDYCFLENTPVPDQFRNLESVIVYRWNRRYPSTVKFPVEMLTGREVVETVEFYGYSHENITMQRYR